MATTIYVKNRQAIDRSDATLDVLPLTKNFVVFDDSKLGNVLAYQWNTDGFVEVVGTVRMRGTTTPDGPYVRALTVTPPQDEHHFLTRWAGVIPTIEDGLLVWQATGVEPDDHRHRISLSGAMSHYHEASRLTYAEGRHAARTYAQETLTPEQFAVWEMAVATGQHNDVQGLSILPVGSAFIAPWFFDVEGHVVCVPRHRHGRREDAAKAVALWSKTQTQGVPAGFRPSFDTLEQLLHHSRNIDKASGIEPKTAKMIDALSDLRRAVSDVTDQVCPSLPYLEETKSSQSKRKVWGWGSTPPTITLPSTHPLWRYDGNPRLLEDWRAIEEALDLNPFSPPEDGAEVDEWDEWTNFEPLWAFNGQLWRAPEDLTPEAFVQAIDRRWATTVARTLMLWPDVVYDLSAPERKREEDELIAQAEALHKERKRLSKLAWARQMVEEVNLPVEPSQTGGRKREPIPSEVQVAVFERDGGACVKCNARADLQFDHIIPHALGGSDSINNIQLLCGPCNRRKGATIGG